MTVNHLEQLISERYHQTVGGGRLVLVSEVLEQIIQKIKDERLASHAIPERLSILKSFQYVAEYRDTIMKVLGEA